ncbi:MAG TPA: malto-oligosyltrehalose synthase [Woeseiaceae bacterium]|nr:malto-oligosyltrehalose synthase [Woeseiaceae bacterium]
MHKPLVATYRLQFREGTTFAAARALVPYFRDLGVSHLYASPVFAAVPGSTHGYDVVDYNAFDEELGGEPGFVAMSDALDDAGLGLVLDFVPNHMGVSERNAWWVDVLRWGAESRHAGTFDISWEAGKILIPILAKPYGTALEDGDMSVVFDAADGQLRLAAGGTKLPLDPRTYSHVFAFLEHEEHDRLVRRFSAATPADGDELADRLAEHLEDPAFAAALERAVAALNADEAALHGLHEEQGWRLAWWRLAREKLSYRRFFEIADLIGVRQEMRRVFRESHRTVVRLARERRVDGLRIDHVDGVADPKGYLRELGQALRSVRREPLLYVEKILAGDERLRPDWNVAGTTGYEFITALAGLYVDASQEEAMTRAYAAFAGGEENLRGMIDEQKRTIFAHNLAGELRVLTDEALGVAARGLDTRDFGRDTLSRAIVEMAAALPVYRTYVGIDGVPAEDVVLIDDAVALVQSRRTVEADEPVGFIGRLLKLEFEDGRDVAGALDFARRFQQTTGAVMAKAVEDTIFYRYNRLIALNEVGGEPDRYGGDVAAFHQAMARRLEDQPEGLLPLATHDTKRGADARARLYALSEAPARWADIVARAAESLSAHREALEDDLTSPDPATEWGFYQSLLGALPADFEPADDAARAELAERLQKYMEKAVREAKRYTSWTSPAEAYEAALAQFVAAATRRDGTTDNRRNGATANRRNGGPDFLAEFWHGVQPFVAAGALNSLSQALLQLTVPGVPDIYQGTEFFDFSLVDPDNRREVDFALRSRTLATSESVHDALAHWRDGAVKARLTAAALASRQQAPGLFTRGAYIPLDVRGAKAEHVVAFARRDAEGRRAVVAVPRLTLALLGERAELPLPRGTWAGTTIALPRELASTTFTDALGGAAPPPGPELDLAPLFETLPLAFLTAL